MFNFKNGISPVIAVILLLAITVVISMSMYSFLQDYTENTISSLSSTNFNQIKVIGVYGDNLYLDSKESELFSLFQIKDLNGNIQCEIRDSKQSTFQGDTRLLMKFDEDSFNGTHIKSGDSTNILGKLTSNVNCSISGISQKSCSFDGSGGIIIQQEDLDFSKLNKISISAWIYPTNVSLISFNPRHIFRYGDDADNVISVRIDNFSRIVTEMGYHNSSYLSHKITRSNSEISLNTWSNVIYTFDGGLGEHKIYINGELDIIEKNQTLKNFLNDSFIDIGIGSTDSGSTNFEGNIDELGIYSKILNQDEVSLLYNSKQSKFYEQLLSSNSKEINLSNCNLNRNSKYEFIGILESGNKISERFTAK